MPVCGLFFGLVNSRPRARFESSSFFGAVLTFWTGLAVVQSGDGNVGVTETIESRPLEKFIGPPRRTHPFLRTRLDCGVPLPFAIPIRRCAVQDRAVRRRENGDWQGESFTVFAPQG